MVGFDFAIESTQQLQQQEEASKLSNPTEPSLPELADLSHLDPLSDFDFIDDWILDNDSADGCDITTFGSAIPEERRVGEETGLGFLIQDKMEKVTLAAPSDVVKDEVPPSYDVLDELKPNEAGGESKAQDGSVEKNVGGKEVVQVEEEGSTTSGSDSEESGSETDGSSSSCSSSSSSEEGEEEEEMVDDIEEGEIKDADEIVFGSDEDEPTIKGPIKSKNEIEILPPVPSVDVTLEPHHQTLPVGKILSIMDTKVVVEGQESHNPLNEGSILWITETRSPLGLVDEIFGPVKNPFYIVRYNSAEEVPGGICEGTPVSFVADFADHVLNDKNLYRKGYDASGENDEEISDEVEFSDDEKEAEYRRSQKMANKGGKNRKNRNPEFVARKKVQHKGKWNNQQSPAQAVEGNSGQTNNPNLFHTPQVEGSFGCGSAPCSFTAGPGNANVPFSVAPAAHVAHTNCCTPQQPLPLPPNGGWVNGMAGQVQQYMVNPNGFPANGMPFQQANHYQQPPQMFNGFPSGIPFHYQFDPSQRPMHNMSSPYGQPSFSPRPSTSWGGPMGQPGFSQGQFGMGQGHHGHSSVNAGVEQNMARTLYNEQSSQMLPPLNMPGNFSAQNQHNQGGNSTQGRSYHHRG